MKFVLAFVLLLMPFASVARDGKALTEDGRLWATMNELSKLTYIGGFRSGFFHGYGTGYIDGSTESGKSLVNASDSIKNNPWQISNGDLKKQMDLFYSDFRNTPVCMSDAIIYAKQSVEGETIKEEGLVLTRKYDHNLPVCR
jgi:hypothetical protein